MAPERHEDTEHPSGATAPAVGVDPGPLDRLVRTVGAEATAKILSALISDAPRLLQGLAEADAAGDAKALRLYAHSLKSNAMMVGAHGLASTLQELERQALELQEWLSSEARQAAGEYEQLMGRMRSLRERYATS
jgi:HPt (histidine-containing phosphotransfer) domain-containing protein